MGDYLSVYDGKDLQATQILQLDLNFNDKRKTVSTSGNQMMIQFLTDDQYISLGFKSYFHYTLIDPTCSEWMDMTMQHLMPPSYPSIDCSWVISSSLGNTIAIQFYTFEVHNNKVCADNVYLPIIFYTISLIMVNHS